MQSFFRNLLCQSHWLFGFAKIEMIILDNKQFESSSNLHIYIKSNCMNLQIFLAGILDGDEDDDGDGLINDVDPDDDGDGILDENDEL